MDAIARVGLVLLAAVPAGLLATAGRLTPDPRGYGTHEQLGLPPCAILRLSGRPCPSCGLTTSFAWFARGGLAASWRANPAGPLLASGLLASIPWLLLTAARGRAPGGRRVGMDLAAAAVVAAGLTVLAWIARRWLSST